MPETLDSISTTKMHEIGCADPAKALSTLKALPGMGITDSMIDDLLPSLLAAMKNSPDPDRALNNFERWFISLTNRAPYYYNLLNHPIALRIFFSICGVSQFFSDILIQNPEYFDILANPSDRAKTKTASTLYQELSAFVDIVSILDMKLDVMRRFKRKEILRIGVRDILDLTDMPTASLEFSDLADVSVQKCLEIAINTISERYGVKNPPAMTIIGMGKLGGRELNYSSDIDLMFVCDDDCDQFQSEKSISPLDFALKTAEHVVNYLSKNIYGGHLFRVDMRLRPEGRFGPLVRTLSSYLAYYESWSEPWERQSLLKARPIAGDPRLASSFMEMITPFVYRPLVTTDFIRSIQENKVRIERKALIDGVEHTNVKIGYGGIRDIEFTIQLLQLELGGKHPIVRTQNTLEAIRRLRQIGALKDTEAMHLAEDYVYLRNLEHRLQILYELQTQTLPFDVKERQLLARRMGYSTLNEFNTNHLFHTQRVHNICRKLFYQRLTDDPLLSPLSQLLENMEEPSAKQEIENLLREFGFVDIPRAFEHLKIATIGGEYGRTRPASQKRFLELAPRLLTACRRTGNPDAALDGLEYLALAMPNREQLYRTLIESDELLDRICLLSASSPALTQTLSRHLEWMDMLVVGDESDAQPQSTENSIAELRGRLSKSDSKDAYWETLSHWYQRQRLLIGAEDIWMEISIREVQKELSIAADTVLDSLLLNAIETAAIRYPETEVLLQSVAVIGLGKLGGMELGYGSDWDILLVYEEEPSSDPPPKLHLSLELMAETLLGASSVLRVRGAEVEIDARLRPEGRFGVLVRSTEDYRSYYLNQADTWERQALMKARYCAGNAATASRFIKIEENAVYEVPFTQKTEDDIKHMKHRIENERLKPELKYSDIKLGFGGINDIEFTAQLYQMKEGGKREKLRIPETVTALHRLGAFGILRISETTRLVETYLFLSQVRNRLALLGGLPTDTLPENTIRLRTLAIGLGVVDSKTDKAEERLRGIIQERMKEARGIVERLFWGC